MLSVGLSSYLTEMSRDSSSTRIIPVKPAPPMASAVDALNRFIWCIEPSSEPAKNTRSVMSQARQEIGCGNWKVVRRDLDATSHS